MIVTYKTVSYTHLDVYKRQKTGEVILDLLKDLHKKENVTLVMVTHEPYVGNMAERIITVLDGKCLTDNKTTNSK